MMHFPRKLLFVLLSSAILLLAGCGSDGGGTEATANTADDAAAPEASSTEDEVPETTDESIPAEPGDEPATADDTAGPDASSTEDEAPETTDEPVTAEPGDEPVTAEAGEEVVEEGADEVGTEPEEAAETEESYGPSPSTEVVIVEPGLFPEGLTYDPVGDRFIVGSFVGGQLLAVADDGTTTPFAESPGANLTGVEADPDRNRLLVAITGLPSGIAQLSVHDLATGDQLEFIDFSTVLPGVPSFANGITVDAEGNIYVTDTGAGVIYRVDSNYEASVFAQDESFTPVDAGTPSGLNGIVSIEGALIVGHAPTGQLLRVDLDDPTQVTTVPSGVDGMVIDGMHLSDDRTSLAVVSNAGSVHVFSSSDGWNSATETGRFDVGPTFPTSVTDRDGTFHVLQSHFDQLGDPEVEFEIVPVVVD